MSRAPKAVDSLRDQQIGLPLNERMKAFMRRRTREVGKTFKSLAAEAGLARTYIYRLADGSVRDPSVKTLVSLARALDVQPVVLFRYYGDLHLRRSSQPWLWKAREDVDAMAFNADVTIPDGAPVGCGECFRKVWEIQNVGTVPWKGRTLVRVDDKYVIAHAKPDGSLVAVVRPHLTALTDHVKVPVTQPGDVVRLEVDFVAPTEACSVASVWRIEGPDGRLCHDPTCILQVVVTVIA